MRLGYSILLVAGVCLALASAAGAATTNMLANPGFETGNFDGWLTFGNAYVEDAIPEEPGHFVPYEGLYLCSMFGNWSGPYNVSGIFQEFPTCPGDEWTFSVKSRHSGYDPMIGSGAPDFNWVVQKIAWFDAGGAEMSGIEATILDGTYPIDTWFDNNPIVGVAPEGAVKMQALVLYIQPASDGGAANIDNCELYFVPGGNSATEPSTWSQIKALYQ
jgi:hypothetical protein